MNLDAIVKPDPQTSAAPAALSLTSLVRFSKLPPYLPALPHMVETLAADEATVGLTVSGFLLIFGLSMLFWGPLSDKYGRRPVMLFGSSLYVVSSIAIALADAIGPLLFWRER